MCRVDLRPVLRLGHVQLLVNRGGTSFGDETRTWMGDQLAVDLERTIGYSPIDGGSATLAEWQRELQEKFDEAFVVLKGSELRAQFGVNQWL